MRRRRLFVALPALAVAALAARSPSLVRAQPPPLEPRRSLEVRPRLWVCGDHRDTGSIQGALVSGTRAAEAVLESGRR